MQSASNHAWPMDYKKNVTSVDGEDGIIERIFEILGENSDKWCVEFGAWDGKYQSNTHNLLKNHAWHGVLIEADGNRFLELATTYKGNDKVSMVNKFITFEGGNSLDSILAATLIPKSFDLLSIDIDGNDYHIWDSLKIYAPKAVVIEFNPTIPNDMEFVQPKNMEVKWGNSLLSIAKLGESKGYKLIAVTSMNAIFIKTEYFNLFGVKDYQSVEMSVMSLRPVNLYETRIFQLYDGSFVLKGHDKMIFHNIRFGEGNFQLLPKFLRVFPDSRMSALQKIFIRIFKFLIEFRRD